MALNTNVTPRDIDLAFKPANTEALRTGIRLCGERKTWVARANRDRCVNWFANHQYLVHLLGVGVLPQSGGFDDWKQAREFFVHEHLKLKGSKVASTATVTGIDTSDTGSTTLDNVTVGPVTNDDAPAPAVCVICGKMIKATKEDITHHANSVHGISLESWLAAHKRVTIEEPVLVKRKTTRDVFGDVGIQKNTTSVSTDQFKVPENDKNYIDFGSLKRKVSLALKNNERTLLFGPRGCGKTSAPKQIAAELNWPFARLNMYDDMTSSKLIGKWIVENGSMRFQHGLLPEALKNGYLLLIDEVFAAPGELLHVMQAVMEGEPLYIEETSEVIHPHDMSRLMFTDNTGGIGSQDGMYGTRNTASACSLDRILLSIKCDYPSEAVERKIVKSHLNGLYVEKTANEVISFATDMRKARKNEEVFYDFSMRRTIGLAWKLEEYDQQNIKKIEALNDVVLNQAREDDREVIKEIAQRHLEGVV